nr:hypothetical protein [uncultured Acetatifactor sp.]
MVQNLKDAGCNSQTIEKVCRLYGNGQVQDAIPFDKLEQFFSENMR